MTNHTPLSNFLFLSFCLMAWLSMFRIGQMWINWKIDFIPEWMQRQRDCDEHLNSIKKWVKREYIECDECLARVSTDSIYTNDSEVLCKTCAPSRWFSLK